MKHLQMSYLSFFQDAICRMSSELANSEEKVTKKSKSKFQDDFRIDDECVVECASSSDFKPMYFSIDRQKRNYVSCDLIKATALDPNSNSFEFEGIIFTSRVKKGDGFTDFSVKFPFKSAKIVYKCIGRMLEKNADAA